MNISGRPTTGVECGHCRPTPTSARKTAKGASTFHQAMPAGASGSSARALSMSVVVPFQPSRKLVKSAAKRHGRSSGQKKPTYGMLTPAAVIMAHRLTGGAAALRPAMMNTMAATRTREMPM